jgi:Ran GTPase-activating protein (RanGAP) involved in mRNA processing and transport
VGPTHIERLMETMAKNVQSKHLLLGNNIVGPRGCAAIAKHIRQQQQQPQQQEADASPPLALLETLYLAGNEVNPAGIADLADALKNDKRVHSLWLKRNPIGSAEGVVALANMLAVNTTIQVLDLDNCGLLDDGLEILVSQGLDHNTTLKHLYLNSNGLTTRSGRALGDYFRRKTARNEAGILSLWVGVNRMDDAGTQALVRGASTYSPLMRLSISSNRFGADTARVISECFSHHPSLISLDVGFYKSTLDLVGGGHVPRERLANSLAPPLTPQTNNLGVSSAA